MKNSRKLKLHKRMLRDYRKFRNSGVYKYTFNNDWYTKDKDMKNLVDTLEEE